MRNDIPTPRKLLGICIPVFVVALTSMIGVYQWVFLS